MADWSEEARKLCTGLREQRAIYGELESHTRRQGAVLLGGRTDEVLDLARSKEATLEKIEKIDEEIAPLKASWHEQRDQLSDDLRAEVQGEFDAMHQVLENLIALEAEQQKIVEAARSETQDKLKKVEGGRRMNLAYGAPAAVQPEPRYLDRSE